MVKSIKRELRDSIIAHMESQLSDDLYGVRLFASFAGEELDQQHIRVTTGQADPHIQGSRNLGRWTVTATISAVSQIDGTDADAHDNMVGLIEAYVLQGNSTLATALTNTSIVVDVVQPGQAAELAIRGMRYSSQELICECRLTGV